MEPQKQTDAGDEWIVVLHPVNYLIWFLDSCSHLRAAERCSLKWLPWQAANKGSQLFLPLRTCYIFTPSTVSWGMNLRAIILKTALNVYPLGNEHLHRPDMFWSSLHRQNAMQVPASLGICIIHVKAVKPSFCKFDLTVLRKNFLHLISFSALTPVGAKQHPLASLHMLVHLQY